MITDFYSRIFGDVMIGFLFEGKNRQHLIDREYEFTASFLGGDVKYTGRPMRTAHAQSPIFGGHFERRLQILRETLRDHAVDPEVQQVWIDHTLALRAQITARQGLGVQGHDASSRQSSRSLSLPLIQINRSSSDAASSPALSSTQMFRLRTVRAKLVALASISVDRHAR